MRWQKAFQDRMAEPSRSAYNISSAQLKANVNNIQIVHTSQVCIAEKSLGMELESCEADTKCFLTQEEIALLIVESGNNNCSSGIALGLTIDLPYRVARGRNLSFN